MIGRIGRQLPIDWWLLNLSGGSALTQSVWMGDVPAGIRKYCMDPDAFAGKRMELAEGRDGMCESGGVVPSNGNELAKLPRRPTTLARWLAFLLEWVRSRVWREARWSCV